MLKIKCFSLLIEYLLMPNQDGNYPINPDSYHAYAKSKALTDIAIQMWL